MASCADTLRELRDIDAKLASIPSVSSSLGLHLPKLESQQVRVVRLIESSECSALQPLRKFVAHDDPSSVLLGWRNLLVDGLEPTEPRLPKVTMILGRLSGQRPIISTSEVQPLGPAHYENPWIDHARRVVAVLIARVERSTEAEPKTPPVIAIPPHLLQRLDAGIAEVRSIESSLNSGFDRVAGLIESKDARHSDIAPKNVLPALDQRDTEAWQASLVAGMTQAKIADLLNRKYPGEKWTQPRVSEAIKRAKSHAEASGLADKIPAALSRAPARTLDPATAELGERTDGRAQYLRERERQMARQNDDED